MSVTSITARLPRVEDRLLLHRQMIETLPSALLVLEAATQDVVEHNAAASAFFEQLLATPRPAVGLLGRPAGEFFPNFGETLEPLLRRAVEMEEVCAADEVRFSVAGGGERFVAVTVQPMSVESS